MLANMLWEKHLRQQLQARRIMEYYRSFDEMCLANFEAYHGRMPDPAMNMVAIRELYCRPWRKTTIPSVRQGFPSEVAI